MIKLGRLGAASELIDEGYETASEAPHKTAWLWTPDQDVGATIEYVDNIKGYMARLGRVVAEASQDETRISNWDAVLEGIPTDDFSV